MVADSWRFRAGLERRRSGSEGPGEGPGRKPATRTGGATATSRPGRESRNGEPGAACIVPKGQQPAEARRLGDRTRRQPDALPRRARSDARGMRSPGRRGGRRRRRSARDRRPRGRRRTPRRGLQPLPRHGVRPRPDRPLRPQVRELPLLRRRRQLGTGHVRGVRPRRHARALGRIRLRLGEPPHLGPHHGAAVPAGHRLRAAGNPEHGRQGSRSGRSGRPQRRRNT